MQKVELVYRDVPMTVEVEYDAGEPAITSGPSDNWHPGAAASAILIRALVGGVDVTPLLRDQSVAVIESQAAERLAA